MPIRTLQFLCYFFRRARTGLTDLGTAPRLAHEAADLAPLDAGEAPRLELGEGLADADHEVGLALEERAVHVGVEELEDDPAVRLGQLQEVPQRHAQLLCGLFLRRRQLKVVEGLKVRQDGAISPVQQNKVRT